MSKSVRPASSQPNYLLFSDVHLGADLVQHARPWTVGRLRRVLQIDRELSSMLDHYREQADPERPWTLSGPVCEAGDLLATDLELGPEAGEGALLAIGEAGAYGVAMASGYNGRLRPAQAVIDGGELRLSRRRETLEDVVARDA